MRVPDYYDKVQGSDPAAKSSEEDSLTKSSVIQSTAGPEIPANVVKHSWEMHPKVDNNVIPGYRYINDIGLKRKE